MERSDKKQTANLCKRCPKADTIDMVQCDNCDDWFHFKCVGVGSDIKHKDWSCSNCKRIGRVKDVVKVNKPSSALDEVKEELGKTKELLATAIAAIGDLKTDVAIAKKDLTDLKEKHELQIQGLQMEIVNLKDNFKSSKIEENIQSKIVIQPAENKSSGFAKLPATHIASESSYLHQAYMKLPYDTCDELKVFTEDLKIVQVYNYIENRLKCLGGDGVTESVTKVLNAVMTPNLQKQLSLTGKGTTKDSLTTKYKQVFDLINDVVRLSYADYTNKTGHEIIGKILRSR